jgi:hypothetical protein
VTAQELIEHLKLEPLPIEGGFFRQTYCSEETIAQAALPARYRGDKPFATAIYYLLTSDADSFSALHRLPTDEVYHFYLGDPVEMLLLFTDGTGRRVVLGQDILNGEQVQFVAPREEWQGSRLVPGGQFALLGTTMAPGFDPTDYEGGRREELLARYPAHADLIRALTRG